MANSDQTILRELAKQYAEIAALPVQRETKRQWHALHRLKPERAMFMIDEIPWHEMNVDDELTNGCADPFAKELENILRRFLYRWNHFRDDYVYDPLIYVPMKIDGVSYGMEAMENTKSTDDANEVISHAYIDQLQTEEDLEKLRPAAVRLDEAETKRREEMAHDAFDGVLEVIMDGYEPYLAPWDRMMEWRGTENWLLDAARRPEFLSKTVDRMIDTHVALIEQLEEKGLLAHSDHLVHCAGAWSDELPAEGYDPKKPRTKDVWAYGMAQILYMVSPKQHYEFEFSKIDRLYGRYGLVYYGCCEPLEGKRLEDAKKIPNLRKISCSAWVKNYPAFAEQLEKKFVMSYKPSPARVAMPDAWDPDFVRDELQTLHDIAKNAGTPCELTLKDISTVGYRPQTVWEWADIMRGIVHA